MTDEFTITPSATAWAVRAEGAELAASDRALELREGDDPAVIFFPRKDVAMALFEPSPRRADDRSKGRGRHLTLVGPDRQIDAAAWTLEAPKPALARLAGHVAFRADRVTLERF